MLDPLASVTRLEQALPAIPPAARLAFAEIRQAVTERRRHAETLEDQRQRLLALVRCAASLAESAEPGPLAKDMLDALVSLCRAERGLVALVEPSGAWAYLAARSIDGRDLDEPDAEISRSVIRRALRQREPVLFADALEAGLAGAASVRALRLRSVACLPLHRDGAPLGFVYLDHRSAPDRFDEATVEAVQACLPLLSVVLERALRHGRPEQSALPGVLTRSERLAETLRALARVARYDVPVLLSGETGVGKGLIARQLHAASPRGGGPFVHVNCAALPESLVESELFGVESGAYTGARASRPGRFEVASGGSLFLDELDSMPLAIQAKLLVAVQERVVVRLGGRKPIPVDVRVISATGRPPEDAIAEGRLREDLYYRLSVVNARIPPLRERVDDLELLAEHALSRARERYGLPPLRLAPEALRQARQHPWPGNVRELENTLERAALLADGGVIARLPLDAPEARPARAVEPRAAEPAWERRMVITREEFERVWDEAQGDVAVVAARLGIAKRSVYRMRRRYEAPEHG